jgi:HemY protein
MQRQDWRQAAALATQAEAAHPGAAWLRDERRQLAMRTGQWREALRLSGPESRASLAVAAADEEPDPAAAMRLARQAFKADPALAPAAIAYARRLRAGRRERAALDVLRQSWSLAPHPNVGEEFIRPAHDKLARAQEAAQLVRSNPGHVESHLFLAQAALDAGLNNEARQQIEAARASGMNQRRLWVLLADVEVAEGHAAAAQDALRHLHEADPDPVWRCGHCGTIHPTWQPVCDACETAGTIAWVQPDQAAQPQHVLLPEKRAIEGLISG